LEDEFQIHGLSPGTRVDLTAKLGVHIITRFYNCSEAFANAQAKIVHDSADSSTVLVRFPCVTASVARDTVVALMFPAEADVPFRLRVKVRAHVTKAIVTASGLLSFEGLPPGSSITSCNGFYQQATQVQVTSWGRVKAFYR
jgi:hypothetical protein